MNGSFVFTEFDNEKNDNSSYEFDPHTDFSQFLEEAKRHSTHDKENPRAENWQNQQVFTKQDVKKSKKSWRNVLFPFWKSSSDKKSKKHSKETSKHVHGHATSPKPRIYVSGPVYGTGPSSSCRYRHNIIGSGPLTGLFQANKREENEIPYVSLERLNQPTNDATIYGPVYLVT